MKLQAIDQWVSAVRLKLKKGAKCSTDLEILWQHCSEASCLNLGYACADGLIKLVEGDLLKIDDVITTAINYTTTANDVKILVYIIGCLIKFQAVRHIEETPNVPFTSPYNYKGRPHPFISIVSSTPTSGDIIDDQAAHMILSCDDSHLSTVLTSLRDAVLYVALKKSNTRKLGSVPAVFKALFRKYSELSTDWREQPLNNIKTLIGHILDYYEPNSENIKYFEEFMFYVNSTEYNTHFMLKLQHCMTRNSSLYDVCLIVRSTSQLLQSCINTGADYNVVAVGYSLVLSCVPLQILASVLVTVAEFLDSCHKNLSFIVLVMLKVSLLKLKFLTISVSCSEELSRRLENLLQIIAKCMMAEREGVMYVPYNHNVSSSYFVLKTYQICFLIHEVTTNNRSRISWLNGIEKCAGKKGMASDDVDDVTLMLSTLLLHDLGNSSISNIFEFAKILKGIKAIGLNYPEASYKLLPILLYSLKSCDDVTTMDVLITLPSLASHANCVAPVLNVIKMVGRNSDCNLKAVSLRMLMELWKIQDRCFPYLLEALYSEVQSVKKFSTDTSIKLIKAAAIAFVCKERPHQHGADMLKLIAIVLTKNPSNAALAYLLEGLYYLCMNTVLDVTSITKKVIIILQENHELVVIKVGLKILALLSDYDIADTAGQTQQNEVLVSIWTLVLSGKPTLADEALYCLSHFNPEYFQIKHLPPAIWPTKSDDVEDVEFLEYVVPFSHHLVIARVTNCIGLSGCTKLLTSILRKELENMPRGIHHKVMKSQLASTQPKAAKSIPDYVSTLYERNKKPGLKAPLALSMLLSQSTYGGEDVQSNASKKTVVTAGRKCMDIIHAMLKEVTIEPHNWQDLIRCSQGWVVFMKKCLTTMTIGRRVETEMQKFDDPEEKDHRIKTATLWCRDKIVNALKAASKNGPSMQGNAVLGLAGLLVAIAQIDDNDQNIAADTEYVSMAHFTQMSLDTIISIAFPGHIASGRLLSWCQYRAISSTGKLCTTHVGRICAIHALPICIPSTQGRHSKVKTILSLLSDDIGDKQFNFHRQISLGNTVSILMKEQTQSSAGNGVSEFSLGKAYRNMLENVEDSLKRPSDLQDVASLIGWGLATMCRISQSAMACDREKAVWENMLHILKSSEISPDTLQTISMVLTWLCLHGCVRGIISTAEAKELLEVLVDCANEIPVKSGFSDSLGTLCCGLKLNGNKDISSTMDKYFTQWFGMVEKGNTPTREKLAALVGLSSLCGASASLFMMPVDPALLTSAQYVSKLSGAIKLLKHLHTSNDVGMQSRCPVYLGCLNMFFENNVHNSSFILPSSYEYLSKSSLLNGMFKILIDNSAPMSNTAQKHLEVSLQCIDEASQDFIMPPVNWSNALNAVLMNSMSIASARVSSVNIMLSQCERSPASSSLLCKCISPGVFHQLPAEAQRNICMCANKIVKAAKEHDFTAFLQMMKEKLLSNKESNMTIAFLTGLEAILCDNKELATSTAEESLKAIFYKSTFSVHSSVDLEVTRRLAACCKYIAIPPFGDVDLNSESHVLLRHLYLSCCLSLDHLQPSIHCAKLALACRQHTDVRNEATWVIAMYALKLKKIVKFTALNDWLKELMKITEEHSDLDQQEDSVVYFVSLVIFLLMCMYYENNCSDFGSFTEGFHPGLVEFSNIMCQRQLPIAVHGALGKNYSVGINECIVNWSEQMIEKLRKHGSSSALLQTLLCTLAIFKDAESVLLPSTWRSVVSILYPS